MLEVGLSNIKLKDIFQRVILYIIHSAFEYLILPMC